MSVSSCPVGGEQQCSCPPRPRVCLFPRHWILLKPWGHSGGESRTGTAGEMRQLHSHSCSSPNPPPDPHPLVNHQVCNIKIFLGAVTNPECPGLTPDQLNQKSLAEEPRRAYFLVKSSGDSTVPPRLKISDRLGRDTVSESQGPQDWVMCLSSRTDSGFQPCCLRGEIKRLTDAHWASTLYRVSVWIPREYTSNSQQRS